MSERVTVAGLAVAAGLHRFVEDEALPGYGVEPDAFWQGLADLVRDFAPRNRELLERRDELQPSLDEWHREHPGDPTRSSTRRSCAASATCSTSPATSR